MRCFMSLRESFFVMSKSKPISWPSRRTVNRGPVTISLELMEKVDFFLLAISPSSFRKLAVGPANSLNRATDVDRWSNAISYTVGGAE